MEASGLLQGLLVCVGRVSGRQAGATKELVAELGGQPFTSQTNSQAISKLPDLVLTSTVACKRFQTLVRHEIPAVTPAWLHACKEQARQAPFSDFLLRPFEGLKISTTGFGAEEKESIGQQVRLNGGQYFKDLDLKHCTHLVCRTGGSLKHQHAVKRGIVCVTLAWIEACIQKGSWVSEDGFTDIPQATASLRKPAEAGTAAEEAGDGQRLGQAAAQPPLPPAQRQQQQQQQQHGGGGCPAGAPGAAPSLPQGKAAEPGGGGAAARGSEGDVAARLSQAVEVGGDEQFLEGLRVHLCGCDSGAQRQLVAVVREGGAARFAELTPNLTHVVVGSALDPVEAAALADFRGSAAGAGTAIVGVEWLRQSFLQRRQLPESSFLWQPPPQAPTTALATAHGTARRLLPQPVAATAGQAAPSALASGSNKPGPSWLASATLQPRQAPLEPASGDAATPAAAAAGPEQDAAAEAAPAPTPARRPAAQLFSGLWFTLAALPESEHEAVRKRIWKFRGQVFDDKTLNAVSSSVTADPGSCCMYAVCPHSLMPPDIAKLKRMRRDFAAVRADHRVTAFWLRACTVAGRVLEHHGTGRAVFRPQNIVLPQPDTFRNVMVGISGLKAGQRQMLEQLIRQAGVRWHPGISRRCTHLLTPFQGGDKYDYALACGIRPVNIDWLYHSLLHQRLMPEHDFPPKPRPPAAASSPSAAGQNAQACRGSAAPAPTSSPSADARPAPEPPQVNFSGLIGQVLRSGGNAGGSSASQAEPAAAAPAAAAAAAAAVSTGGSDSCQAAGAARSGAGAAAPGTLSRGHSLLSGIMEDSNLWPASQDAPAPSSQHIPVNTPDAVKVYSQRQPGPGNEAGDNSRLGYPSRAAATPAAADGGPEALARGTRLFSSGKRAAAVDPGTTAGMRQSENTPSNGSGSHAEQAGSAAAAGAEADADAPAVGARRSLFQMVVQGGSGKAAAEEAGDAAVCGRPEQEEAMLEEAAILMQTHLRTRQHSAAAGDLDDTLLSQPVPSRSGGSNSGFSGATNGSCARLSSDTAAELQPARPGPAAAAGRGRSRRPRRGGAEPDLDASGHLPFSQIDRPQLGYGHGSTERGGVLQRIAAGKRQRASDGKGQSGSSSGSAAKRLAASAEPSAGGTVRSTGRSRSRALGRGQC